MAAFFFFVGGGGVWAPLHEILEATLRVHYSCHLQLANTDIAHRFDCETSEGTGWRGMSRIKETSPHCSKPVTCESFVKCHLVSITGSAVHHHASTAVPVTVSIHHWTLDDVFVCRASPALNRAKALHPAVCHLWGEGGRKQQRCLSPLKTCLWSVRRMRLALCF